MSEKIFKYFKLKIEAWLSIIFDNSLKERWSTFSRIITEINDETMEALIKRVHKLFFVVNL